MKRLIALFLALMVFCMAGCSGTANNKQEPAQIDMSQLYTQMETTLPQMVELDEAMMLNLCGIKAEQCKQAVVAIANDGLRADEVWLIEAADADALAALKTMAENRIKYKGEESITYSPQQYEIVQKGKILTEGSYLIVLVSPDVETLEAAYKTAAYQ